MNEPLETVGRNETSGAEPDRWRWLRSLGPGLVTACVVIGPGSILTSSKVGATYGYDRTWVVLVAVACMMVYMGLGARLGVVTGQSAGDLVTRMAGRPLAVLIGLGVFFISAAYQFGNNLGVNSAVEDYLREFATDLGMSTAVEEFNRFGGTLIVFNGLAIAFLFAFKNLYRALERLMSVFVGLMLLAFAINLCFALVNQTPGERVASLETPPVIDLSLLGLVGTTFVITAAYYQSYLVRFKGWRLPELKKGLIDSRVGSVLMALITLMIMSNAAAVFYGKVNGDELGSVGDVAAQLEAAFGAKGRAVFCIGLFSAAYSSFLVNSMIGGFILSDGLGLGSKPTDLAPRLFTVAVLLTGMGVATYVIRSGQQPVAGIVAAQAATVLAAPLMAGTLWWLTSKREVMGEHVNGPAMHVAAALGFILLLGMAYRLAAFEIPGRLNDLLAAPAVQQAD